MKPTLRLYAYGSHVSKIKAARARRAAVNAPVPIPTEHQAALEKRRQHLEEVGLWPERLKRQPPTVTGGDLHRARLQVGSDRQPGREHLAAETIERYEDRKRRRPRRHGPRGHYDTPKKDGRREQSPEQRARRKAAWTEERRAAQRALTAEIGRAASATASRRTSGAVKMGDPRHAKHKGTKLRRC